MSTSSATALTRAPKRLKDIKTEPVILPSTVEILDAKKAELDALHEQHAAAVKAQLAVERNEHGFPTHKTSPDLEFKKLALADQIERVQGELTLLQEQVKRDRALSPEVKSEADALVRQRALAVIGLRKINAAIDRLRAEGAHIPVDIAVVPGGYCPWGSLLLGHSTNVGLNGKAAKGYLGEVFAAGLISSAEMREDS
jgi:hypothetical protein